MNGRLLAGFAVASSLAACAVPERTTPPGAIAHEGTERFSIVVLEHVPSPVASGAATWFTAKDAECTLRNDKGEWRVGPSRPVEVATSVKELEVECATRDFAPRKYRLPCATQQQRQSREHSDLAVSILAALPTLGASLIGEAAVRIGDADQRVADSANPHECRYSWGKSPVLQVMLDRRRDGNPP